MSLKGFHLLFITASVLLGAHIVRVHGVAEMIDVVRTADAIRQAAGT